MSSLPFFVVGLGGKQFFAGGCWPCAQQMNNWAVGGSNLANAWRIIPVSKWLITMVSKSPKWGYSPYKWPKWLVNRGS